jgi:hypothetical protein
VALEPRDNELVETRRALTRNVVTAADARGSGVERRDLSGSSSAGRRNGGGISRVEGGVTMANGWLVAIVGGAGVLALGVGAAVAREPATWVEPAAYEYAVEFRCGMQFPPGQYTLTVANGVVIKVVGESALSKEVLGRRQSKPEWFPTLGKLFKEFQTAKTEDADVAKISFDQDDRCD